MEKISTRWMILTDLTKNAVSGTQEADWYVEGVIIEE